MTTKQKNLARLTLENPKMEKGKLVELGGYGHSAQKTPAKALDSVGYKKALAEFGLTDELISSSLVDDIIAKPGKREPELRLGAAILGMTKKEEGGNNNVLILNISQEVAEKHRLNAFNTSTSGNS